MTRDAGPVPHLASLTVDLPDGRRGRVYVRARSGLPGDGGARLAEAFARADPPLGGGGLARARMRLVGDGQVRVDLQPARGGERRFVVVSLDRLERLVAESSLVVEGPALQVAGVRRLTGDAVLAAAQAWAERCLPAPPIPEIVALRWEGPGVLLPRTLRPGVNARRGLGRAAEATPFGGAPRGLAG